MSEDNKQDFNKGITGSFVWLLMAAFIIALMVQNFVETKFAKVGFSYQLEHLVNLQMLQPEESRKTAINDNLATFTGKFRERLTEEGKNRYKYLELLNTRHNLQGNKIELEEELKTGREKIADSVELFLQLSGIPIPPGGYVVYDDIYTSPDSDNSVIINKLSDRKVESLTDLKREYSVVASAPTSQNVDKLGTLISSSIRGFRSPYLGIGNEATKQTLRKIDSEVTNVNTGSSSVALRLAVYDKAIGVLSDVVSELSISDGRVRLLKLRSVRDYNETLAEFHHVNSQLEDNYAKLDKARTTVSNVLWYYNNKELSTRALERQDQEEYNHWFSKTNEEWKNFPSNRGGVFKAPDQPLNVVLEKTFKSEEPTPNYISYIIPMLPVLLVILVLYFIFSRQMKGMGSNAMNFGKSPAKLLQKGKHKVTFKDVAGVDEAIEELEEIVDFLRDPQKFTALGGHIPKGVLCIGPPGTGKTLIAKAVAGEADRPFFSISGSDFVEMFVGVGASRIRDMFEQAKKNAPCIIFMDEIDAVGRHRGAGVGGGHDEREQTLNQLLVEMDGFDTNDGVILIAATNRPDVLDKALLRPGRFDRRVVVNLPDIKGRYDILKVHAKKIKLDKDVDLMKIARSTPGSSGADLENILNEAALIAARMEKTAVTMTDLNHARDKVLYGKERRSLELDENEKLTTAYHESGHTVVSCVMEHSDPVDKVTIIPRGMSLGSTMFLPKKNRVSYWKRELIDQLAVLMGGRCAEEIFVEDVSSGAKQDIEQATNIARAMVCEWGMSEDLGLVAYDEKSEGGQYHGMQGASQKRYSEETAKAIDDEVKAILDAAYKRAYQILESRRKEVELMTKMLMEFETLDSEDIELIVSGKWDEEEKRARVKRLEELHAKKPVTPPPPPKEEASKKGEEPPAAPTLQPDIRV